MKFAGFREQIKKGFFLEVDPNADTISVPRLLANRTRSLLWVSLITNGLLLSSIISLLHQNNLDQAIVYHSANMAKSTQHLSELYASQVEDLASAYTHYGKALQSEAPEERQKNLAIYHQKIQNFNNRSYELAHVSTAIRDQAQKIAGLFQSKERG
ncbi:hypothetical protein [Acanthopleuribacter pedis]|uniref:Uncharacterized protein n=1 Tax=Acanthopleuribacter pedis TaxID=442870 RepID=A0A8J7QJ66_9BACT|nr:hypothetical protein [Acanthopleuribacter pedis]MBO1323385.1 hypothetical protein [Acanthopleuribacter pedis]